MAEATNTKIQTVPQAQELELRPPHTVSEGGDAVLAMIERAARDNSVDVEKMERLLAMRDREMERRARMAFTVSLASVQEELPIIGERGATDKSKYALWEDINRIIKPILQKNGFALSFRTGEENNKIAITGVLSHRDGHSEQTTMYLPSDTSGSKNAVQAVGSSLSYGRRYTAMALLNITSGDEVDDDGEAAGGNGAVSPEQVKTILQVAEKVGANVPQFCKYMKVDAVPDIRAKDYEKAIATLNLKAERGKK